MDFPRSMIIQTKKPYLNEDLTQQFSLPVYSYNLLLEIHKFFENQDMLKIRLIKVTLESQSPTWKQKAGLNK
jgi:hypothetical protein